MLESSNYRIENSITQIRIASASGNVQLWTVSGNDTSGHILSGYVNSSKSKSTKNNPDLWSNDFHTYEIEWNPYKIIFKVDGEAYNTEETDYSTESPVYN